MNQLENLEIRNLNHLGIIAGIIDEIGIVEIINEKLGTDSSEIVSSGGVRSKTVGNAKQAIAYKMRTKKVNRLSLND